MDIKAPEPHTQPTQIESLMSRVTQLEIRIADLEYALKIERLLPPQDNLHTDALRKHETFLHFDINKFLDIKKLASAVAQEMLQRSRLG